MNKKTMKIFGLLMIFIVFGMVFAGCVSQAPDPNRRTITITGSTTVLPVTQLTAESYLDKNPNDDIQITSGGSSVGVIAAAERTADIGQSSRDITQAEIERYPDLNIIIIALDGLALIVHPSNTGVSNLTIDQVKDIFSGEITNWSQVGGDDRPIVVAIRDAASGTRAFFSDFVMKGEDYARGSLERNSNGAVRQTVAQTPGAIGYVGLGFLDAEVKAINIINNDVPVQPTVANTVKGDYPLARPLIFLTKGEPQGLVKDYIDFVLSEEGQTIVTKAGFVPIR